jgi:hypothetical protein
MSNPSDEDLKDLVRNLADAVAALSTRVERGTFQTTRIANASEETNAMALNEVREAKAAHEGVLGELVEIRGKLAVLVDNIKDAEDAADEAKVAVREATGGFPRQDLDVGDTDKTIGKVVRHVAGKALPWFLTTGAGAALMHLWHWLAGHGR